MKSIERVVVCGFVTMAACLGGCNTLENTGDSFGAAGGEINRSDVDAVLDQWHADASQGNTESYFSAMTEGSVFMGTDETERWDRETFRAYATPHFADGHGWTYTPRDRHISTNAYGDVAWVDETLDHDKYGVLRGTAVMRLNGEEWRIAFYSLTFLVPNNAASHVVETIKREGSMDSGG